MTTCLSIRNATLWADTRSIERISCFKYENIQTYHPQNTIQAYAKTSHDN